MKYALPLKVLILEDNTFDAEIIIRYLQKADLNFIHHITDNKEIFISLITDFKPDIILSDFNLPSFTGIEALDIIKKQHIYIPVIIITGSLNEEVAADCIKSGAYDYILKDNIKRLPFAIQSALEHKNLKEEKENALLILTQNEENFRLLAENATDVIWKMNKDLITTYISPSIIGLTGFSQEEHLNNSLQQRFSIKSYKLLTEKIIPELNSDLKNNNLNKIYKHEMEYISKKGGIIRTEVIFKVLTDKYNNFIGVQGSSRSIEERKLNEEALIKSEEKYRLLANNISDVIFTADMNMNVNYISPSVFQLLGYDPDEIKQMNMSQYLTPESLEILRQSRQDSMIQMMENPDIIFENQFFELEHICKNGETLWTETSLSLIKNNDNIPIGVNGVIRNIKERKRVEKELIEAKNKAEEANKLKSNFLANMSHELRTPLNGILGFAEILKEEITDNEHNEMINIILRSGNRLKNTLNALLDISAIESGTQSINKHSFDLDELLIEVIKLYEENARQKNIEIIYSFQHNKQIISDDSIIYKVINNLIDNAVKYTEKGSIEITTLIQSDSYEENLIINIKDTGIGIEADTFDLIFEDFRQVSEGKSRNYDGNGLGLSIARRLLKLLNGSISLKSEPGKGSIFTIQIPITIISEKAINEINENIKSLLLLVEDDETNALLALSFLKKKYIIDIVYNGEDAIKKVSEKQYDGILMDINLGSGISGIEAVNQIKQKKNYKNIPVAAVTAHAMKGQQEEFLCKGCTHYLAKPYTKDDMLNLINNMLK